jgi:predicted Zn finger-like uncharacterized protein
MLIVCPSCATSYDVALATLSPQGRQVRCSRCHAVWHAELSPADKLLAAAAAIAPEPVAVEPAAEAATTASDSSPPAGSQLDDVQAVEDQDSVPTETSETLIEAAQVEAPPIVPADPEQNEPPIEVAAEDPAAQAREPAEDIETIAARRSRRAAKKSRARWPLSRLQSGVLALVLINIVLIGWRSDVVRAMPQTASFYALLGLPVNLRGLTFDGVVTSIEQHDGVPILVVEGNVFNAARKAEDLPRLKFIVRNAARQEIYSWTAVPARNVLQPGEVEPFRTRLASPPLDAHDLILRFINRRDILAGTR